MYIHGNNETDKMINVSKIANTSTLDDNSTAAGCNSYKPTVNFLGLFVLLIKWKRCDLKSCHFTATATLNVSAITTASLCLGVYWATKTIFIGAWIRRCVELQPQSGRVHRARGAGGRSRQQGSGALQAPPPDAPRTKDSSTPGSTQPCIPQAGAAIIGGTGGHVPPTFWLGGTQT